jgi:RNA polymerase sigma-70 factor (TIGR02943 family)
MKEMDTPRPDTTRKNHPMAQPFPTEDRPASEGLPGPDEWLDRYGDSLYRYALDRLRQPHEAEETVQETLLAALAARGQFASRSHPRTWLMGILKHKVMDRLRSAARAAPATDLDNLDTWFDKRGKWRKAPWRWDDPAIAVERSEFWSVVRRCLGKLPPRMAEAFTLRALDDQAATDVCRELAISPANLWVLLHRARAQMVRCLELHWFNVKGPPC